MFKMSSKPVVWYMINTFIVTVIMLLPICLYTYYFRMSMAPNGEIQKALSTFLSLNPNIHLLPPVTLTHLTVLYVQVSKE